LGCAAGRGGEDVTVSELPPALAERLRSQGTRFVVTGASGWLGRVTLDLLRDVAPLSAFASRARGEFEALEDLAAPPGAGPVVLLHYAFLTKDNVVALGPAAFVAANEAITARVLEFIASERPMGVLMTSSGAALSGRPLQDDPYGALKRREEALFAEACAKSGSRLRTARVFNVSGRHITKPDRYALGTLIADARAGRPLRIHARGPVLRSYVAIEDVVVLGLLDLLDDSRPDQLTFDTAGDTVEIGELAEVVRDALGRYDLAIERVHEPVGAADVYVGERTRMDELMALHGLARTPLAEQVRRTAEGIQ